MLQFVFAYGAQGKVIKLFLLTRFWDLQLPNKIKLSFGVYVMVFFQQYKLYAGRVLMLVLVVACVE